MSRLNFSKTKNCLFEWAGFDFGQRKRDRPYDFGTYEKMETNQKIIMEDEYDGNKFFRGLMAALMLMALVVLFFIIFFG